MNNKIGAVLLSKYLTPETFSRFSLFTAGEAMRKPLHRGWAGSLWGGLAPGTLARRAYPDICITISSPVPKGTRPISFSPISLSPSVSVSPLLNSTSYHSKISDV